MRAKVRAAKIAMAYGCAHYPCENRAAAVETVHFEKNMAKGMDKGVSFFGSCVVHLPAAMARVEARQTRWLHRPGSYSWQPKGWKPDPAFWEVAK